MDTYSTGDIRRDLANLSPNGSICHQTWKEWRKAVRPQITGHKCTYDQWVQLCAAFALHRMGKRVTAWEVRVFVRDNGNDPMAYFPGLLPIGVPETLPSSCLGRDIPDLIFQWLGVERSEDTISMWCKKSGFAYSRGLVYGKEQILLIVYQCARAMSAKRTQALKNLRKKKVAA